MTIFSFQNLFIKSTRPFTFLYENIFNSNMRKTLLLFIYLAISTSIFTVVYFHNARGLKRIHREPSNNITDVSVKLGRNDKYNWSYTGQLNKEYKQFAPALNMTEYTMYMNLIKTLINAFETFNITYLLEGGSVLGAYRYHGFVPWDDDFDCKVNASQKHIVKKALEGIRGHILHSPNHSLWKFFSNNSARACLPYKWKWPFIDIFFFTDNETHVYDVTYMEPILFHPLSDILPLEKGIFENMIMPVPHNMEAYLNREYNMKEHCQSNWWNHKHETNPVIKSSRILCNKLLDVYPLVHRIKIGNISFEELRLGNKVLYRVERPSMNLLKP